MSKQTWVYIHLAAIAILFLSVANNIHWSDKKNKQIVRADARGYYAYLPAILLHGDVALESFKSIDPVYDQYHPDVPIMKNIDGNWVNKYPIGESVLLSPFFGIAHVLAGISGDPQDGYSRWYQIMVNIAGVVFLLIGLLFTNSILTKLNLLHVQRMIILWVLALGTPLFYYAIKEPGMSHVYSFALIAAFSWMVWGLRSRRRRVDFFLLGLVTGLIFITRPVNILVVLSIPFLLGDIKVLKELIQSVFQSPTLLFAGIVGLLLGAFPQLLYFYSQAGSIWVDSYPGEHFHFLDNQAINFLFSYKKGFFLYTPIAFLSLLGFWFMGKKNMFQALSLAAFLIVLIYIFSSWWSWWKCLYRCWNFTRNWNNYCKWWCLGVLWWRRWTYFY